MISGIIHYCWRKLRLSVIMGTIISNSGEIIQLPYFGCWSGCAKDYCFMFGKEIPSQLFFSLFLCGMIFCVGILLCFIIYLKRRFINN